MLSGRIKTLYEVLKCNNTDIARFARCSSGNISRLKSGNRVPKPESRTIALFVNGIYDYADYENLLPQLLRLIGISDRSDQTLEDLNRENVTTRLAAWLYDVDKVVLPPGDILPKSRKLKESRLKNFGNRLDRIMNLLNLTNGQLASHLNIDPSLVSRYRSGIYSPYGNESLSEKMSEYLLIRAEKAGKTAELNNLCGTDISDTDSLSRWLYEVSEETPTMFAEMLLHSLDNLPQKIDLPPVDALDTDIEIRDRYWGTEGLRNAVVRFLSDAAKNGGELLLYSDEPMDWMTADRKFLEMWASLMMRCVSAGVHIRIIHNLDRGIREMVEAIVKWFPLYISGNIEPYAFPKDRYSRFCYTSFIRPGSACILGMFPSGSGEERWYEYITDKERLSAAESEYHSMLSSASPFLKTFTLSMGDEFRDLITKKPGTQKYLVTSLPLFTMPEELILNILKRFPGPGALKDEIMSVYKKMRGAFLERLKKDHIHLMLCQTDERMNKINFPLDLIDLDIEYTQEEYSWHLKAVTGLVRNEPNFHLTILPIAPFKESQLMTMSDSVAIFRCHRPYTAFRFMDSRLTRSVSDYLDNLIMQYSRDRATTSLLP
ncbi:MAG: helix-turn-helix domain-containing protein [Lachnospiraceae bacterium]|nr:helix-turn-helix domain-containing protein [Lachnospiraceae bacterium]